MSNILFFIKTLVVTFFLAALMQAKIGQTTIEAHIMSWVANSHMTEPLQQVAEGGGKLVHDSWYQVKGWIESKIKAQKYSDFSLGSGSSQRRSRIKLQRSKAFLKEQAQKAREEVKEEFHRQADKAWEKVE